MMTLSEMVLQFVCKKIKFFMLFFTNKPIVFYKTGKKIQNNDFILGHVNIITKMFTNFDNL